MNAADIGGGAGFDSATNPNLNQHQFHPVHDAKEAYTAMKTVEKVGAVVARVAPFILPF